jgi:VWFA-related protein
MNRWGILLLILSAAFISFAWAQAPATPEAKSGSDRAITLDVVVTDKSGKPVSGLQEQDFTLLDNKHPQKIVSFQANTANSRMEDSSLQVILFVDAVNTTFHGVANMRTQLDMFLKQDGGRLSLPTSLAMMTDTSQAQTPSTRDGNILVGTLDSKQSGLREIGRAAGFYGGEDRVGISLNTLTMLASKLAAQPGRKLLIWLSPGWPLLSGPNIELTSKEEQWIFDEVVKISTELREARITLYAVDPMGMDDAGSFRTFYYQSFLGGVSKPSSVQNGNLGLQVLAVQSGGQVFNSSNDVAGAIANCLADARAFYTLTFDAPRAEHPNEYHSLQVKVDKPKLKLRTRTGYYAQP